jgi:hypothetical protein
MLLRANMQLSSFFGLLVTELYALSHMCVVTSSMPVGGFHPVPARTSLYASSLARSQSV